VLHLASVLSGLAVVQLKHPGAAFVSGGLPSPMDLRTVRPAYGSPESCLNTAAAMDVSRYLGLPFMGTAGASESKQVDAQAASEIAIQILMSGLSGATLVHDVGFLDCADIGSLDLLVLADEIIGMVRRILRGVPVSKETLMLDLIEQVGPGGYFVAEKRSAVLCRTEFWMPKLGDREPYTIWESKGSRTMEERIHQRLIAILDGALHEPLPHEVQQAIDAILQAAEERQKTV
jgi:trimethylamine---corrinoid protein Co-methyltransferase